MNQLRGTGVALVTPFGEDGGVDFRALERLVDYVIDKGADYLVALGTTAETPTLTESEKDEVARRIVKTAADRVPIVIGMGGNNTAGLVEKIRSSDLSPYAGILSVAPYYNKPGQEGLYQHFKAIASACPIPVVLYNVPGRTGVNMLPETTLRLAGEFENISAIKEASGNMSQILHLIEHRPAGFEVISGDDALAVTMASAGSAGVISVLANSHPERCSRMVRQALNGEKEQAEEQDRRFKRLVALLFEEGNPVGVKAVLKLLGICSDAVRLPLVAASEGLRTKLKEELLGL